MKKGLFFGLAAVAVASLSSCGGGCQVCTNSSLTTCKEVEVCMDLYTTCADVDSLKTETTVNYNKAAFDAAISALEAAGYTCAKK